MVKLYLSRLWLTVLRKVRFISQARYEMKIVALEIPTSETCWADEPEYPGFHLHVPSVLNRLSDKATLPAVTKRSEDGRHITYDNGDVIRVASKSKKLDWALTR